jgi:hypothetical protein
MAAAVAAVAAVEVFKPVVELGYSDKVVTVRIQPTLAATPEAGVHSQIMVAVGVVLVKVRALSVLFGPVVQDIFHQHERQMNNELIH